MQMLICSLPGSPAGRSPRTLLHCRPLPGPPSLAHTLVPTLATAAPCPAPLDCTRGASRVGARHEARGEGPILGFTLGPCIPLTETTRRPRKQADRAEGPGIGPNHVAGLESRFSSSALGLAPSHSAGVAGRDAEQSSGRAWLPSMVLTPEVWGDPQVHTGSRMTPRDPRAGSGGGLSWFP